MTIPRQNNAVLFVARLMLLCVLPASSVVMAEEARFRYVDACGERLNHSDYFYASDFSCGFGIAQATNGEWVVVDSAGNEKGTGIVGDPGEFRGDPCFSEGVALLSVDDDEKTGRARTYAIGADASVLFMRESRPAWPFCHGIALVSEGGKDFPIDYAGLVLHSNQYGWAMLFRDSTLGYGLRYGEKRGLERTFLFDGTGHETRFGQGWKGVDHAGSYYAEYGENKGGYEDRLIRVRSA